MSDSYKWLAKPLWDSRPDVDCWEVVDADGGPVFFGGFDDVFTGKRQALLVASAPELLGALEELEALGGLGQTAHRIIRDAIAKARGEA